jgi:hypothetical protein
MTVSSAIVPLDVVATCEWPTAPLARRSPPLAVAPDVMFALLAGAQAQDGHLDGPRHLRPLLRHLPLVHQHHLSQLPGSGNLPARTSGLGLDKSYDVWRTKKRTGYAKIQKIQKIHAYVECRMSNVECVCVYVWRVKKLSQHRIIVIITSSIHPSLSSLISTAGQPGQSTTPPHSSHLSHSSSSGS